LLLLHLLLLPILSTVSCFSSSPRPLPLSAILTVSHKLRKSSEFPSSAPRKHTPGRSGSGGGARGEFPNPRDTPWCFYPSRSSHRRVGGMPRYMPKLVEKASTSFSPCPLCFLPPLKLGPICTSMLPLV
jgi:hypothetical protein